ncbi:MAG: RICIN domain-containing protein [Rudaea sp.]|uniref:RICIN domain-containing protein n=1 Tax=unclassified Rudaea TaxID=2627037 RepID=UPI0010F9DA30|nr:MULTISPECIES: RICIN domain-containing protein [unclassified Rudaea]MBN8886215.1 RICIN domain-containing protein [Rudaea sp.]
MAFTPVPGASYYLVAAHSGKVLEIKDKATQNGAIVQQGDAKPYLDSSHQQWEFLLNSERIYVIRSKLVDRVLDIEAASKDDAAKVHMWGWHGVDHERFRIVDAGDGTFYLEAVHSGKVIEIYGEEKGAGHPAKQYRNHLSGKNLHQRFRPVLAEEGFDPKALPGFTNPSQMVRDATLGIAGLIPEVGGAIKGVVSLLWRDGNSAMIWNQVMRYIEAYVESKLQQERIKYLRQTIDGSRKNLNDFVGYTAGSEKAGKLNATITTLNLADRPFFDASAPERTLSYFVTIGTIKLTLLQEQARNYAEIAGEKTDVNKRQHVAAMKEGIAEYTHAAQYFREQVLKARVDQIGNDFRVLDRTPSYHQFTYDIILRDGGDGGEVVIRIGPNGGAQTVQGREEAKVRLKKAREQTVRALLGARLDAILAPALLWRSFDPEETRPSTKIVSTSVGPYGNVHDPVKLSQGKEIAKIEVWSDDRVRGLRVTNRSGAQKMVGGTLGTRQELLLAKDEFIAGVWGSAYHYLHSVFFETTFGKRLGAGRLDVAYRFHADLPPELSAHLVDITASSGNNHVDSIQFDWQYELKGEYPQPKVLRSESTLWSPLPAQSEEAEVTAKPKRRLAAKKKATKRATSEKRAPAKRSGKTPRPSKAATKAAKTTRRSPAKKAKSSRNKGRA